MGEHEFLSIKNSSGGDERDRLNSKRKFIPMCLYFPPWTGQINSSTRRTAEELLKKQQVLYTRLSLSDDQEEQRAMKDGIMESSRRFGVPTRCGPGLCFLKHDQHN